MPKKKYTNEYFDKHKESYAEEIMTIQSVFYENTGNLINNTIKNSLKVLDIGNGGVINYSFNHLETLVCADLSVSQTAIKKYINNSNVKFVKADILDLQNFSNGEFDTVIVQAVLHHLAGSTLIKTNKNVEKAIIECW